MNKTLLRSFAEFISFGIDLYCKNKIKCIEDLEDFLGVEFAYEGGPFPSDIKADTEEDDGCISETDAWDGEPVDFTRYRTIEDDFERYLPESYPCVIVHKFSDDFDRFGKVTFQMYEFIYLTDFVVKE